MTTWITICDTCKRENWAESGADQTDGEVFAAQIELAAAHVPNVRTRRTSCLMGCTRACNVAVQASGKLAYTLGAFAPDEESAEGIVAYAHCTHKAKPDKCPTKRGRRRSRGTL